MVDRKIEGVGDEFRPELLTFAEAGLILGIGAASVAKAVAAGQLVAVNAPGTRGKRAFKVLRRSVEEWIEQAGDTAREGQR